VKALPSSIAYGRWLALVRVLTGGIWLAHAIPKFIRSDAFLPPAGSIVQLVGKSVQADPAAPYAQFLGHVVQPYIGIFAELVRLGELMVGVALVLGVLTRLGAIGGIVLALNFMAARGGLLSLEDWGGLDGTLLILTAVSLVLPTGRVWGVDALFGKQAEPEPTVRAVFVDEPPIGPPPSPPSQN
jgi:uncharacterized membrane protein YphA (DoxX/SURF4 family)